jgi:hypothetical protein
VSGESIDLAEYIQAVNTQRRVLATLGLERCANATKHSVDVKETRIYRSSEEVRQELRQRQMAVIELTPEDIAELDEGKGG